jgi:hypothetical protein
VIDVHKVEPENSKLSDLDSETRQVRCHDDQGLYVDICYSFRVPVGHQWRLMVLTLRQQSPVSGQDEGHARGIIREGSVQDKTVLCPA